MKPLWDSQQNLGETSPGRGEPKGYTDGVSNSEIMVTSVSNDCLTLSFRVMGLSRLPPKETGRDIEEITAK